MPALSRTARRLVQTPHGQLIATLTETGVTLRPPRKHKAIFLSYEDIAKHALEALSHLHWPDSLKHKPLMQVQHLSRRKL